MLRSSARAGQPEVTIEAEMDYPRILNKALPEEIRVLGWTPVPDTFNARQVVLLTKRLCCVAAASCCAELRLGLLVCWLAW
jgi:hypothetical protein